MTSLTPTRCFPADDTPLLLALEPGEAVFAEDVSLGEADALGDLMDELMWRREMVVYRAQQRGRR